MNIDTTFLRRCIASLERAVEEIERQEGRDDVMYDIYRAAGVKEFELVLEQSGKLLRKRLAAWLASNRQADRLHFKDLFRHAARHGLIAPGGRAVAALPGQPQLHGARLRRGFRGSHPQAASGLYRGRESPRRRDRAGQG